MSDTMMNWPRPGGAGAAEFAPAKVNLFLHVTGRREDGYHLLDSLAVFAGVGDDLAVSPAEALTLEIDGPEGDALAAEPDNLVLRAARLLAESHGIPGGAALRLTKRLPVASGIGGGSADAAAALRLLARHWQLPLPAEEKVTRLGADVPVCVASRAARMGGIGEELAPAPRFPAYGLLLANPRIPLSTPAVFRARAPGFTPPAELPASWPNARAMAEDLRRCTNDLEAPARQLCPAVAEVLSAIASRQDCLLARMSGSGATCFGLFPDPTAAQAAAGTLPPAWWRWGGAPA
ncbi:4-(cytidine 5'-diphospho)-2-C-methyl-D-erythritol kinase [Roseomonas gilardii subsp. gilardii]|uniref:4-(cytidine 5'-diphospho)-2-C-methyl-D-erythritol kinase n=1 Tax=Roseomonas gilardii TaxID=257708 RepID=UPI001FFB906B|nr:4-(cytidine 5'-diphospho)-2-C-methyl-D-erythritol kinase [Roseomonas gilardii]UPG72499.1 4-(cytidine 5'-diphospho)-2-C-methyl-D-erythritol kinase [Roseomonas gilardii subsp. gilardii]